MSAVEFTLNSIWQWTIWLVAAMLFACLAFLEIRRKNKRQRLWRLAATFTATLSLALLCLEPTYLAEEHPSDAFLLTAHFSAKHVQAAADSLRPAQCFRLPRADSADELSGVKLLPNVAMLHRQYPNLQHLHIFGDGLRSDELEMLEPIALTLHLNTLPEGIIFVSFPKHITLGEQLQIQGTWHALRYDSLWLYLEGSGRRSDSLLLVGEGKLPFELTTTPKQAGEWCYTLYAIRSAHDTLCAESIPVSVRKPAPIRMLIVERAPNFETRTLKQWAAAMGNALALRSTISRGKALTEFLNMSSLALEHLSAAVLDKFDIAIVDFQTLVNLSAREQAALRQAVENGLGLLIALSEPPTASQAKAYDFFLGFLKATPAKNQVRFAKLHGLPSQVSVSSALPVAPIRLQVGFAVEVLMHDEASHPLVIVGKRGLGKVAVSIVEETFRWALEGKSSLYAEYWSYTLKRLARAQTQADVWQSATLLPTVDLPCKLMLRTRSPRPIGLIAYPSGISDSVFFKQSLVESSLWETVFWPREQGWHRIWRIGEPDSAAVAFYVHTSSEWLSYRRAQMQSATRNFAQMQEQRSFQTDVAEVRRAVPQWWFFVLFVIAAGYLWAERQL
ncbi:MAG: hypothetical protein ACK42Y_05990 [Candidatus Thermochlorobacter sp.]